MNQIFGAGISITKLITKCGSIDETLDAILFASICIAVLCKIFLIDLHKEQLKIIITSAFTDWKTVDNNEHFSIMKIHSETSLLMSKLYTGIGILSLVSYMVKRFILDPKNDLLEYMSNNFTNTAPIPRAYPLPGGCAFDGSNLFIYYFIVISQFLQLSVSIFLNFGIETLYVGICSHICGQFEILNTEFIKIGTYDNLEKNKIILHKLIKKHQRVAKITELMEDCFNGILLFQMLAGVILLSIGGK